MHAPKYAKFARMYSSSKSNVVNYVWWPYAIKYFLGQVIPQLMRQFDVIYHGFKLHVLLLLNLSFCENIDMLNEYDVKFGR